MFNEKIKNIPLLEFLALFIILLAAMFGLNFFNIHINSSLLYVIIIVYFLFKLRNSFSEFKADLLNVFSTVSFRTIMAIVILNILFSYGMLYFSDFILQWVNASDFHVPFMSLNGGIVGTLGFLSVVFLSPIAEELIFRGIFLNKLKIIVPAIFAVLISSLLFASLHSFGSIFSAFIFGICMAILYLKSENILVPIFGHFINNMIGESVYHLDYGKILFNNEIVVVIMSVLAVVSFAFLLKFIFSNLKIFK